MLARIAVFVALKTRYQSPRQKVSSQKSSEQEPPGSLGIS